MSGERSTVGRYAFSGQFHSTCPKRHQLCLFFLAALTIKHFGSFIPMVSSAEPHGRRHLTLKKNDRSAGIAPRADSSITGS